ncbi:hypothetical protein [Mediterraneibacter agrestimuris]|uniref:hypothetical protein n=1 Tax=Mediterraneibacter agrestimuris TaxID=2941333 RepID=UPI0020419DA7|nr:hypothetical protein [Mediterraneibacter agrestimuris]
MMRFEKNIEERKVLVKRLGELTGIAPHYTKVPRCAYEIGAYTVERDGSLTVEEDAAESGILTTLREEGLIRADEGIIGTAPEENAEEAQQEQTEESPDTRDEADAIPDSGYGAEPQEGAAAQEGEESLDMVISLPMGAHTGVSLRNLVNMVYSRGPLLSRATGGNFHVAKELAEALQDDSCTTAVQSFLKTLTDYTEAHGGMEGLKITEEQISFTGFPVPADKAHADAFCQLAAMMNGMALSQKRIQAKEVNTDNEKYAFRIWLLRLGMNGDDYKSTRKVLMENLGGHAAFRTPEEAKKAKAKNKAKREAQKKELAELEADTRLNAELNGLDEAQTAEAVADAAYIAAVNAAFGE